LNKILWSYICRICIRKRRKGYTRNSSY